MRTAVLIVAIVVFLFGFIMEYGAWLFAWFSRLTGLHTPAATYADFVDAVAATMMMMEHGLLRIVAPWALMAVGLALFWVVGRVGKVSEAGSERLDSGSHR